MTQYHSYQANGAWKRLTLVEQLANVGSEVHRAINWKTKNNTNSTKLAFYRALELIDLTMQTVSNEKQLTEIARTRELLVDYFLGNNVYGSTSNAWRKYFFAYTVATAIQHGR